MKIAFDPAKRAKTLLERDLDFLEAVEVFAGLTVTQTDDRVDYGEVRHQTFGLLRGRLVLVVWTQRGDVLHIISMRRCNDREKAKFADRLGQV